MASDKSDNIKVVVRIRGLIPREEEQKCVEAWLKDGENSIIKANANEKYSFNKVYGINQPTMEIFDDLINPIMEDVMKGINGAVFAYGQTSSGKTFTMLGKEGSPGIIHMCISSIFNKIENTPDREYLVRASYMEIYNENIVDLLGDARKQLNLGETLEGEVIVKDLQENTVKNSEDCYECLKKGEKARHYEQTNMNDRSSRSHVIFRVIIESKLRDEIEDDASFFVSQLNLIDLAGSEKLKQTGNTGQRMVEGSYINKSLLTLSQVISQLSSNASHISYRDSRLTRILQNSLGGNSKTAFICAVTPVALDETLSTLRFAMNVRKIKNKPIINEKVPESAQLPRLTKELEQVKKKLASAVEQNLSLNQTVQGYNKKIALLENQIIVSSQTKNTPRDAAKKRRETWCPGKATKLTVLNFQSTLQEEADDDLSESNEASEPSRRSCGINFPGFELPKSICISTDQPSLTNSDEVDLLRQKYDFECDLRERQIQILTTENKKMKKQLEKIVDNVQSVGKNQVQVELEKQLEIYFVKDEEKVYSMVSPIKRSLDEKSLEVEDKILQTSIFECQEDACPKSIQEIESREKNIQTSFIVFDNEFMKTEKESHEMMIQTSFLIDETEISDESAKLIHLDENNKTSFSGDESGTFLASCKNVETNEKSFQTSFVDGAENYSKANVEMFETMCQTSFVHEGDTSREEQDVEYSEKMIQTSFLVDVHETSFEKSSMKESPDIDFEDNNTQTSFVEDDTKEVNKLLEGKINSYQEMIDEYENDIKSRKVKLDDYERKMTDYENKISDYESKHQSYEDRLSLSIERVKTSEDEVDSLKAEISKLEDKISSKDLEIEQFKSQMKETENNLENISDLFSNSKSQMDNLCKEIQTANQQILELKSKNGTSLKVQEDQEKVIESLQMQLNKSLQERDELKGALGSMDSSVDSVLAVKNHYELVLRDLLDTHKRELSDMDKMHFDVVDSMKREKALATEELNQELGSLKKKLSSLESKYEEAMENLQASQHETESNEIKISDSLIKNNEEFERLKEDFEERISQLNGQIESLKEQHKIEILGANNLTSDLENQLEECNAQLLVSSAEFKKQIEMMEDEYRIKIQELDAEHLKEVEYLNKLHAEVLEEIKKESLRPGNETTLNELCTLRDRLDLAESNVEESHLRYSTLEIELKEKSDELKAAHTKLNDFEEILERCKLDHRDALTLLNSEKDEFKTQIDDCNRKIEELKEYQKHEFGTLKELHEKELEKIKRDHVVLLEDLNSLHAEEMEKKLATEKETFETKLATLNNSHKDELESLSRLHVENLALVEKDHLMQIEKLKISYAEQYKDKLESTEVCIQKQIDDLHESYKKKLDESSKVYSEVMENCKQKTSEIDSLRYEIDQLKTSGMVVIEHLQQKHSEELESTKKLQAEQLEALSAERDSLLEKFKSIETDYTSKDKEMIIRLEKELLHLRQEHSEELESMKKLHATQLEALSAEHDSLLEKFKSIETDYTSKDKEMIVQLEKELQHLQQEHSEELESMKKFHAKQLEALSDERDSLLEKFKSIETDYTSKDKEMIARLEKELDRLKKLHSEEMEKLQKDHSLSIDKLKASYVGQMEELCKERDDLELLQGHMKTQFLHLLDSFHIDIASGLDGKTNPTREMLVDNLFTSLHAFINSKIKHEQKLTEELKKANEDYMMEMEKSSQVPLEYIQREEQLKVELLEKESQLKGELEKCKADQVRYKDGRDKALCLLKTREENYKTIKNNYKMLEIQNETLRMREDQAQKRENDLLGRLEKLKMSLDSQMVEKLKEEKRNLMQEFAKKDEDYKALKKLINDLKGEILAKNLEISKNIMQIAELKSELESLHSVSQSAAVSVPDRSLESTGKPSASSGLPHSVNFTLALATTQLTAKSAEVNHLKNEIKECQMKLYSVTTERNALRLELHNEKKKLEKNKENLSSGSGDDRQNLEDTVALYARNIQR